MPKEPLLLFLIKGSNWRLDVCDVVSTMSYHPYRNETVRLLLHHECAIGVSFLLHKRFLKNLLCNCTIDCYSFKIQAIIKRGRCTEKETEEKLNMKPSYQLSAEEVRMQVNGKLTPLTDEEVREHQEQYGKNELTEGKKKSTLQIFLEQFKDFLVIILIVAATVSGFMGDVESAAVILIVITMNAILGTVQTVKAEQSLQSLKKLSGPVAKVLRNGNVVQVPSSELTIGDEVMLEAGDYVPADGRILKNASLKIDESALTGESLGVEKTEEVIEGEVPLGDRTNMVFSGSFVTYGRGSFIVTSIGMETEVGKIASLLKSTSEKKTPLQVNLDQFGQKLSILILIF